jgi:hypothetical protein
MHVLTCQRAAYPITWRERLVPLVGTVSWYVAYLQKGSLQSVRVGLCNSLPQSVCAVSTFFLLR